MINSHTQSLVLDSKSGGLRPLRVRVPLPALGLGPERSLKTLAPSQAGPIRFQDLSADRPPTGPPRRSDSRVGTFHLPQRLRTQSDNRSRPTPEPYAGRHELPVNSTQHLGVTMWTRLSGLSGIALAVLLPMSVSAQAICSAPHSSPTLSQGGAISTLPPGGGWVQLSYFRQRSTAFFNQRGDSQDFLADSDFLTRSVFLTASVGLVEGVDLWAQVPVHNLDVVSDGGNSSSSGVGDLRIALRITPAFFGLDSPVPLGLRIGGKVPNTTFPVDATVLPLTEGQNDFELSLESGTALNILPVYIAGWLGYRWRGLSDVRQYKPGTEAFGHFAVGGALGDLTLEVGSDFLWGQPATVSGLTLSGDEARRLFQIVPTVGYPVGPGKGEVSGQFPLAGRNLPNGTGLGVSYRTTWGLDLF